MRLLVLALLFTLPAPAAELTLATAGRATMPIVLSPTASPATKAVAAELADCLRRITGAAFEITTGDGSAGIVLGTLAQFPDPALDRPLEIRNRFDSLEAYAIRAEPGRLRLVGAADPGASHAAFRFLELLGCRWFFPAREWEIVPSIPTLTFSTDEADRPAIPSRRIWYGYGFFSNQARADYDAWARRNRMASSLPIRAGHAWQTIIANHKNRFDDHPEYRALVKGKRQGEQLCVSNPAVRQLAVDHALAHFAKHPDDLMVSMECSDGGGHCECEACAALGTVSERVFGLANHVARAVAKEYPGKMVGLLAYNDHAEPPAAPLEPNVYVQLTQGFVVGRHTLDELMDLWPKRCANLGFYDYYSVYLWDFDKLPGGRAADTSYIRKQIAAYAARNATSVDAESGNNWGPHGRGYYLANRLLWNPRAAPELILKDFYDKAFGPAAAPMRRYYERLDPANKPLVSRHLIALACRDVDDAARLANDRPDVLARLDHLKQYLRYNHLAWLRDREPDKAKKKALALAALTHAYRTRASYMNHWQAILSSDVPKYAKEFDEPTWSDRTSPKPWTIETPPTREETRKDFAEGLAYFVPQAAEEFTFSKELVPARLEDPAPLAGAYHFQGGARFAFYSPVGEPIRLTVVTGTIAWYRDRPDARYTLRVADGAQPVAQGRLPLDGQPHVLELKVGGPGLHYFDFDDSAAGWKVTTPAGQRATLLLRRDKPLAHLGHMPRTYFYVPRNTRQISYYWSGGPHKVLTPDGKIAADITTSGEFVTLRVPAGADGRPWSFKQLAPGHLWFLNCPNALAPSPSALLLPADVAERER